ncbi:ABC transporter permease [Hymenobacter yonginensis]|uniref:ABC transporter permease n=1 Tax=Hymenobacter yonginensis TaxID=748197 RepID=A0ABY7PJ78_9BACT|nr:ABC transporter permease [Hymenobacter yonginensis]WBO83361.1 ABC transporter permease [Hymenobacter yonginensis]
MKHQPPFYRWGQGVGWSWLLLLLAAALLADLLPLPAFPDLLHTSAPPLTPGHPLGTDPQGHDVLGSLVHGARTVLLMSVPATLLATLLGVVLGGGAGYWGNTGLRLPLAVLVTGGIIGLLYLLLQAPASGWSAIWWPAVLLSIGAGGAGLLARRRWLQRPVALPIDTWFSLAIVMLAALPRLVVVLIVAASIEPNAIFITALLVVVSWPVPARLMRAETRRIRQLPYLEAARALGLPTYSLLLHHVLPNSWRVLRASLPMNLAVLIGLETTLSFLGVGLPPELPSWGRLLAASRLSPDSWWLIVFPVAALVLTALALRQVLPATKARSN